jgi:M6 family metalloprotease-like protein
MKKLLILLLASMVCLQTIAVPADPTPRTVTQPNGEEITLIMNGDEYIHWAETLDGYTLLINSEFYFCYAQRDVSGSLEPSSYIATEISNRSQEVSAWLQNINKKMFFSENQVYYYMQLREIAEIEKSKRSFETIGVCKIPLILMQYPDRPFTRAKEEFEMLFNQINYYENGFRGSVRDFFLEASYNKLEIEATIVGPYTTVQNAAYYAYEPTPNNNPNYPVFAREAITAACNDGFNFSEFTTTGNTIENLYLIYAGHDKSNGCGTCIWAHHSPGFTYNYGGYSFKTYTASSELEHASGTTLATIGTFCHEFGHTLGAPDYYDINYDIGGKYDGTGNWDLQAHGSGNNNGRVPATPNPRSKVYTYGWANAIELSTPQKCTIPAARIYDNAYFRINIPHSDSYCTEQYFILEYKDQKGFDANTPGKNLLIYRCTENYAGNPYHMNTTSWQRFYPVSANANVKVPEAGTNKQSQYGSINFSTCTWPQTNKTEFTPTSIPGMVTWGGTDVINKSITNIVAHNDFVTFDFDGGGDKSNFHVFLPTYYGCVVTAQSGSTSPVNKGGNFSFKIDLLPTHNKSNLVVTANNDILLPFGDIYTIYNIQEDQIVRITGLEFNTFSITATAYPNGRIIPEGNIQINQGGIQMFEIRPDNGYSINRVIVDGEDMENIKSYTFKNVQSPHSINAFFKTGDLYTINSSKDYFYFEAHTGIPSDTVEVTVSSPDVIANITATVPTGFQISANNGKTWQQGFQIKPNQLPFTVSIRFNPSSVGTVEELLTLKSTEAYAEIKLTGKALLGINDNAIENTIAIFPNPTTGKFTIESGELRIENIEVFDTFGRKVFEQKAESKKQNEIDISNLSSGIYIITIHTDKGMVNKKVVKE